MLLVVEYFKVNTENMNAQEHLCCTVFPEQYCKFLHVLLEFP